MEPIWLNVKNLAEKAREHTGVYFVVDTLEFLRRGGRIGGAQALLGSALNIKPILELTGWTDRISGKSPHQEQGHTTE